MADQDHGDRKGGIKGDAGRRERLAAQLRENLLRRKALSRRQANAEAAGGGRNSDGGAARKARDEDA